MPDVRSAASARGLGCRRVRGWDDNRLATRRLDRIRARLKLLLRDDLVDVGQNRLEG